MNIAGTPAVLAGVEIDEDVAAGEEVSVSVTVVVGAAVVEEVSVSVVVVVGADVEIVGEVILISMELE